MLLLAFNMLIKANSRSRIKIMNKQLSYYKSQDSKCGSCLIFRAAIKDQSTP